MWIDEFGQYWDVSNGNKFRWDVQRGAWELVPDEQVATVRPPAPKEEPMCPRCKRMRAVERKGEWWCCWCLHEWAKV